MIKRVVFDTWALVALLEQEEPAASRVRAYLEQAAEGEVECYLSLINLGEIYYITGRKHGKPAAAETLAALHETPVVLLPITEDEVVEAAAFKMTHPISYADAFALSASSKLQATLVTGEPELGRLNHLVDIAFLQANR